MADQWETYYERGAFLFAGATCLNCAPMNFHQMSRDRQPQTEAPVLAGSCAIRLSKTVEDESQEFGANAFACVLDFNLGVRIPLTQMHAHVTANGSELDCIGKQIPDYLLKPVSIA